MPTQPALTPVSYKSISKPDRVAAWLLQPDVLFRIGLFLLIALYARTIGFDFVYDDLAIPINPWIQSWKGLIEVFRHDIFGAGGEVGSAYYRPLTSAIEVLVARLTSGSPGWFHLASLIVQVIVYFLAYTFGLLLFEDAPIAALTAVLFALHPTRVEGIAFIGSGLCDGQAAIYFFGSIICYLKWWKSRKTAWIAASTLLFACAMFTKETMVVIPALIALHYWLNVGEDSKIGKLALLMLPYVCVTGIYLFARHAFLHPLPSTSIAVHPTFTGVNLWTAPVALWWYLQRLLLPIGMAALYDSIVVTKPDVRTFALPLLALVVLCAVIAWFYHRHRSSRFAFLTGLFCLTLGPAIALAPMVSQHDRYVYLASYSFCALLAFFILAAAKKGPQTRRMSAVFALTIIAAWSLSAWHESSFWADDFRLWQRAVQIAPHSVNARVELARLYEAQNSAAALQVLDDGLRLLPDSPGLWRMRGIVLFNQGHYQEARETLLRALNSSARFDSDPNSEPPDVRNGRATVAFLLGQIDVIEGNLTSADRWLRMALAIQPRNLDFNRSFLMILEKQGLIFEANEQQQIVNRLIAETSLARR